MRGLVVLLLLCGCDRVFGLHSVSGAADARASDTLLRTVMGQAHVLFAHRSPVGENVLETRLGIPGGLTIKYETDTSETLVPIDDTGAFSFQAPLGPYRLTVQANGVTYVNELQLSDDAIDLELAVRRTPSALDLGPQGVPLSFQIESPPQLPRFATIGEWSPDTDTQQVSSNVYIGTTLSSLDPTLGDEVLLLGYADTSFAPLNHLTDLGIVNPTVPSTGPITLSVTMAPLTPSCFAISGNFDATLGRLAAVGMPDDQTATSWQVFAVPTTELAPTYTGIMIAQGIGDDQAEVAPLLNLPRLGAIAVTRTRTVNNIDVGSLLTSVHQITSPGGVCPGSSAVESFESTVAIASFPTFGGVTLDTDGATVSRAGRAVLELTWAPSSDPVDGWEVEIDELVPNATNQATPIRSILTDTTSLEIPSAILATGTPYIIRINGVKGLPNARHGNFTTPSYPFELSSVASHPFVVQ